MPRDGRIGAVVKFLIIIIAVVLLLWWVLGRQRRRPPDGSETPPHRPSTPADPAESMVACAHCGVHLPRSEAQLAAGRTYCCKAHGLAGPREPQP